MSKIYFGDCLKIMPKIPDKSVDMILADLPYGLTSCKWDSPIPLDLLWSQYKRIIKDRGAIVLMSSQPFTSLLVMSNIEMFKYEWVWEKKRPTGYQMAKIKPMKSYESILVFSKGATANKSNKNMIYHPQGLTPIYQKRIVKHSPQYMGSRPNQMGREYVRQFTNYPRTVLKFDNVSKQESGIHPTQKPVALFEYLIRTYTNLGDLVMDNVAGSGTTGIACLNTKRRFILIEKEKKYYEIMRDRLKKHLKEEL